MAFKRNTAGKGEASLAEHYAGLDEALARLPRCVVFFGGGEFLRSEASRRYKHAWLQKFPGGDIFVFNMASDVKPLTFPDLLGELSGNSLFSKEKLVIVRQAERLLFPSSRGGDGGGEEAGGTAEPGREKRFIDYLAEPSSTAWLLFETNQLPRNRVVGKRMAELTVTVSCPVAQVREAPRWLKARAGDSGKRLSVEATEMLVQAHGPDLGVLASELDKLSLFTADRDDITADDVAQFLTGSVEFEIFGLTNAFEERDLAKAALYARRVTREGTRDQRGKKDDGERSAHRAMAMLAGTAQSMLRVRVALAEGKSPADAAGLAGMSPWRAERLVSAAKRFSLPELRRMNSFIAREIARSHDTGGDAPLSLEKSTMQLR